MYKVAAWVVLLKTFAPPMMNSPETKITEILTDLRQRNSLAKEEAATCIDVCNAMLKKEFHCEESAKLLDDLFFNYMLE